MCTTTDDHVQLPTGWNGCDWTRETKKTCIRCLVAYIERQIKVWRLNVLDVDRSPSQGAASQIIIVKMINCHNFFGWWPKEDENISFNYSKYLRGALRQRWLTHRLPTVRFILSLTLKLISDEFVPVINHTHTVLSEATDERPHSCIRKINRSSDTKWCRANIANGAISKMNLLSNVKTQNDVAAETKRYARASIIYLVVCLFSVVAALRRCHRWHRKLWYIHFTIANA